LYPHACSSLWFLAPMIARRNPFEKKCIFDSQEFMKSSIFFHITFMNFPIIQRLQQQ
jgi:hypothetical protein